MKRRNFLGWMAASPLAAKQVAEEASMKLAGVSVGTAQNTLGLAGYATSSTTRAPSTSRSLIAKLLRKAIPDFKLHELKRQSKQVYHIHPDISALKSVSFAAKFKMQQAQSFSSFKQDFLDDYEFSFQKEREEFQEKHGWYI